jgi:hypothetical protein
VVDERLGEQHHLQPRFLELHELLLRHRVFEACFDDALVRCEGVPAGIVGHSQVLLVGPGCSHHDHDHDADHDADHDHDADYDYDYDDDADDHYDYDADYDLTWRGAV